MFMTGQSSKFKHLGIGMCPGFCFPGLLVFLKSFRTCYHSFDSSVIEISANQGPRNQGREPVPSGAVCLRRLDQGFTS